MAENFAQDTLLEILITYPLIYIAITSFKCYLTTILTTEPPCRFFTKMCISVLVPKNLIMSKDQRKYIFDHPSYRLIIPVFKKYTTPKITVARKGITEMSEMVNALRKTQATQITYH